MLQFAISRRQGDQENLIMKRQNVCCRPLLFPRPILWPISDHHNVNVNSLNIFHIWIKIFLFNRNNLCAARSANVADSYLCARSSGIHVLMTQLNNKLPECFFCASFYSAILPKKNLVSSKKQDRDISLITFTEKREPSAALLKEAPPLFIRL